MLNSVDGVYSVINAPTASFKNQDTWIDPLVITDVIWEAIPKTTNFNLVGYSHESQTDHIHMSQGELVFVLVKDSQAHYVELKTGDGKVLIIQPNVWHSAVNLRDQDAVFLNMAKRHAAPGTHDFTQSGCPVKIPNFHYRTTTTV